MGKEKGNKNILDKGGRLSVWRIGKVAISAILSVLLVSMAAGTIIEKNFGNLTATQSIYHAPWFLALWLFLTLIGISALFSSKMWKRIPVFLLHISLVVILAGALITHLSSRDGTIHLRQGAKANFYFPTQDEHATALPFTLRLDSFKVNYYPGTTAPSDYVSYVSLLDNDNGTITQTQAISMNRILAAHGYRFYQTSFDSDLRGTILSVSYDPWGTGITYFGYALLALSMIWTLFSKRAGFRRLLNHPLMRTPRRLAVLAILLAVPMLAMARESIPSINDDVAHRVARQQVVWGDRVVPLGTLALDFVRKIHGKDSYRGLSPEQVLFGWGLRPDVWKEQPMIYIKNAELRKRLGIEGKYARFSDLFNGKDYKLEAMFSTQTSPSEQKALQELDEKVGLILMLTQGTLVQPAPVEARISKYRVEAELLLGRIPFTKVLFMFNLTLGFLGMALLVYSISRRKSSRRERLLWNTLRWLLSAALLLHACGYLLRWYAGARIPLSNGYETMLFLALAIMALSLWICRRFLFALPLGFLLSGFTLLVSHLGQMNPRITMLMPVLNSPLLSLHVSLVMMAYALLALTMMNALTALTLRGMKRGQRKEEQRTFAELTLLSRILLYPAVFLLAAGIFLGAVWANQSWGTYWSWDPKEVWALITLLVYAVPLHRRSLKFLNNPTHFNAYMLIAFLSVLITYFGVNYLIGGMHSYA